MSSLNGTLRYIHIQRLLSNKLVGQYPFEVDEKIVEDYNEISNKLLKSLVNDNYHIFDKKSSIKSNNSIYYYLINEERILIFISTDLNYPEEKALFFFDVLTSKNILDMVDDEGTLTHEGQLNLNYLFDEYNIHQEETITIEKTKENHIKNEMSSENNEKNEEKQNSFNKNSNEEKSDSNKIKNELQEENLESKVVTELNKGAASKSDSFIKEIDSKVKKRYWIIRILFFSCILIYILVPIFINLNETKLGSKRKIKDNKVG